MIRKHKKPVVIIAAIRRELTGFIWAIARVVEGQAASVPESAAKATPLPKLKSAVRSAAKDRNSPKSKARTYIIDPDKKYVPRKVVVPASR